MTCPEHFVCAQCRKTFTRTPGRDPQALAEARFGGPVTDGVSVCEECNRKFQDWLATPAGQQALAEWNAAGRP